MVKWLGLLIGGLLGSVVGGSLEGFVDIIAFVLLSLAGYLLGTWLEFQSHPLTRHRHRFNQDSEAFRHLLHQSTFLMMGYLAKADGTVSKKEIEAAEAIFDSFNLNEVARKEAIRLFSEGKNTDFDLNTILEPLSSVARNYNGLIRVFLEIQARMVIAEGGLNEATRKPFFMIARRLGFSDQAAGNIIRQVRARSVTPASIKMDDAYSLLDVSERCSDKELKLAYRRAMSEHHPDKLHKDGATDNMIQAATEQTQAIQHAYQSIKKKRQG